MRQIKIATRSSPLALAQANKVAQLLTSYLKNANSSIFNYEIELHTLDTLADKRLDVAIKDLGASGAFVKEVERAVLSGQADCAVHSAKDLPSDPTNNELYLASVPERVDPRDILLGSKLSGLAVGARVATGSLRRKVQLLALRPDLEIIGLRGNIATRLNKIPENGAIIAAKAALDRLKIDIDENSTLFSVQEMLPQVGQGALAITCNVDDKDLISLLRAINDEKAGLCLSAERSFLAEIGMGCTAPVGAYATAESLDDQSGAVNISLQAVMASENQKVIVKRSLSATDPICLGKNLAHDIQEIISYYNSSPHSVNIASGQSIYIDKGGQ